MRPIPLILGLATALACLLAAVAELPADSDTTQPQRVTIGRGGKDGFVAVGKSGRIHVVYGGKYTTGRTPSDLRPAEQITELQPVYTIRMTVDSADQPHVVFTAGMTDNAKRSYYTARINGAWLPAEKFADADDYPERTRAYVADVAADDQGNVLVCFWISRPREKRAEFDNPSFYYRWRSRDGEWGAPSSLPAHWSSAPKVEYEPQRGFYLLWQARGTEWRIAGPVPAGEAFQVEQSIATGSEKLTGLSTVQNEGADFTIGHAGKRVVVGNVREKFTGPVGVWAGIGQPESAISATYLGSFANTKRGDESSVHPVACVDADTGATYVTVMNPADKRAYFAVHDGHRWRLPYQPLLPEEKPPQGTLRQGPSVADLPGPGVIALVRDGDETWRLCVLPPPAGPTGKSDSP